MRRGPRCPRSAARASTCNGRPRPRRGCTTRRIGRGARRTPEWRAQAERLLTDVEQWSGASETAERDCFYQKAVLFTWLLDLMPPGPSRTRALRGFVEFLRRTETDVNRRMLWFAFVNRLLELTHSSARAEVLSAMENSQQPVLSLYARLERLAPDRRP